MTNGTFAQFILGDENAFKTIFNEYYPSLVAFARRFLPDESAQDVAQDAFVQLWNRHHEFQNPDTLKSWLFTAIKNHCLNLLRNNDTEKRYLESLTETDFEDHIMDMEVYILLYKTIDNLPDHYRTAIRLSLNGYSLEEIAMEMSVTIDAVKAYKKRGKEMLRKNMQQLFGTTLTVAALLLLG